MLVTLLMGLAFVVVASHGELTINHDYTGMTPASLIQKEARGPNRYEYTVNLMVGLNSSMSLSTLNQSRSILWALTQRLTNSSVASIPIFSIANSAIRQDPVIRSTFKCSPNETDCNSITVNPIRLQSIGDYSYQSFINTLDSVIIDYNVSTWVHPLDMQCGGGGGGINQTSCAANKTQSVVSVLGSTSVTVSCSILIAQNDQYDPKANLVIRSVEDNMDCSDTDSTQVLMIPPIIAQTILNPLNGPSGNTGSVNQVLYRLTRNCTKIFTKASLNSRLTCQLQPRSPQNDNLPTELQPPSPYTTLTMTVDVQYPPEYSAPPSQQFNRTMIVNSSASATPVFTCPFDSNPPPQFEWRVALVVINRTDSSSPPRRRLDITEFLTAGKDYVIPRDLEVGLYGFECRAKTLGLVNKYSDTVKFYLSVIPVPVSSKKGSSTNVGAIVGGVVGGVLAIAVIVLLVLFLIRRHRNGLKDEPEKAKELDIGLNENNPHLSSRSNLSTAGLTAATATTTSSSSSSTSSGPITTTTTTTSTTAAVVTNTAATKSAVGIGHKAIAGLMVPSSTAQSYAAIAHAAAAAAAQQNRNNQQFTNQESNPINSSNTIMFQQQQQLKTTAQSYNNPGFFESTSSYAIQQPQSHLESPPPYDSALHHQQQQQQQQQQSAKKDQQMMLQSQQKDYMGSNSRLLGGSGSNTPTLIQKNPNGMGSSGGLGLIPQSHSYSHQLGAAPSSTPVGMSNSLQQMQQQQQYPAGASSSSSQTALQYTTVQNLQARNRQPLNANGDMVDQSAGTTGSAANTQYTTMAQLNPIDV